ncbi:MAG TPA: hypothetical protein VKA68_07135, partial [bacterium]|nr:hypothetical protein [bacterium]
PAHKASHLGSPLAALTRLPVPQALDMVDSFQSTREPRLRLALQIDTDHDRFGLLKNLETLCIFLIERWNALSEHRRGGVHPVNGYFLFIMFPVSLIFA